MLDEKQMFLMTEKEHEAIDKNIYNLSNSSNSSLSKLFTCGSEWVFLAERDRQKKEKRKEDYIKGLEVCRVE